MDKDSFNREFYFYNKEEGQEIIDTIDDKLELAKECHVRQGTAYLNSILEEQNKQKFDGKKIELNMIKSAGLGDYMNKEYIDLINNLMVMPDRNKKKEIYVS